MNAVNAEPQPIRSSLRTAIRGVTVLGPGWPRLSCLFGLSVLVTVFEGFGVGMMLPVASLMQKGEGALDGLRSEGYWRHLASVADAIGVPLSLTTLLLAILALFVIRNALMYARTVALMSSMQRTMCDIRVRGFALFLRAKTDFQSHMSAGRLANDLSAQVGTATGAIYALLTLSAIMLTGIYYLGFLMVLSFKLTIAIMALAFLAVLIVLPLSRSANVVGEHLVRANQATSSFLLECLGAARLIRLAQMEKPEAAEMRVRASRQAECEIKIAQLSARTSMIMETFVVICGLALLYVGTSVLALDFATIGVTLLILLRQLPVAREFVVARQAIISNVPSVATLMSLFDAMQAAAERDDGSRGEVHLKRQIALRDVVVRYDADREPALSGVSLTFPAGKMTALVGPSGGGKSTLIDLLPRLRDPTSGEILIDGESIRQYKRSALRTLIGYTPQAPQMFNSSIAQHIRYGKPDATDAEVSEAARLAGAEEFIDKLPDRYDTLLGERGGRLSGGQRQRIDVARALLGGAEVLILDEPTSNVDAEAEHYFEQTLQGIRKGSRRTIIVVGHRLSTIRSADQIAVVDNGRVAECGSHDELVKAGGWYAKAYQLQSQDTALNEVKP